MTDAEKRLREFAQAATPGEWRAETDGGMNPLMPWRIARPFEPRHATTARRPYHALYSTDADARFAVAAQPSAVLALLDRIEALEKWQDEAVRLHEKGDRYVADHVWAEKHRREREAL